MPLTKKMLKNYMIEKHQLTVGTLPERQFNGWQESRGLNLLWDRSGRRIPFIDPRTKEAVRFQCDFLHPTDGFYDYDCEVDGIHHTSPQNILNDNWRDAILNANGIRVIRIPTIICPPAFWYYLDEKVPQAIASKEGTVRIPG